MILVVSSEFPPGPGGIGQHAFSFVSQLSKTYSVSILTNQDWALVHEIDDFNSYTAPHFNTTILVKRNIFLHRFLRIFQFVSLLRKLNPQCVIFTGKPSLILSFFVFSAKKIAFVHGSEIPQTKGWYAFPIIQALLRMDTVFAVSHYTNSRLKEIKINTAIVLPNGIDANLLTIGQQPQQSFHWKGDPRLLTVGNLTPRKGQHRVIQALPVIATQFPNVQYHMVGLPTTKPQLEQLSITLGVAAHITFHNRLPKREALYRAFVSADIFIMLSENQPNGDVEGFGIAILEANAFGIPAIGAKGCGIEDAISAQSGILVDGNNHTEITKAIKTILNNYQAYSTGARNWAEQHNWNALIKKVVGQSLRD